MKSLNFQIIDVIKIKRTRQSSETANKSCSVLSCRIFGESLFFYKDKEFTVRRGDVLYIPVSSSYQQSSINEEIICFHLETTNCTITELSCFPPDDVGEICRLFQKAYALWTKKEKNYRFHCTAVLYEIIARTFPDLEEEKNGVSSILVPSVRYIEENLYTENFSLDVACKKSFISRAYFNRLFQKQFACTPIAYVHQKRIERAKQLLLTESYTNEEIAELCGFGDVKYFYVLFKKLTGLTTKQYMKNSNFKALR